MKKNIFKLKKFTNLLKKLNFFELNLNLIKDSNFSISKISNSDKYQKIIKKINEFSKIETQLINSKQNHNRNSKIDKLSDSNKYQNIISQLFKLKNKTPTKKSKNIKQKSSIIILQTRKILKSFRSEYIQKYKTLKNYKIFQTKLKSKKANPKYNQKVGLVFYGDHNLIIISVSIDLNNKINVVGATEIPIPGNVIGDLLVEDINELSNIAMDSLNLLDLVDSPLLVILSSSFFTVHTFSVSDLKQISETDSKVQSKSPYLPANTLVEFLRISDSKSSDDVIRATYSNKELVDSWTDTLQIIDQPIIGLVPAAPHIFDLITSNIIEPLTILIDIESNNTNLFIGGKLSKLNSYKLPFGYSLYVSDNLKESSSQYFERVLNSIKINLEKDNQRVPKKIFVMGSGLDRLVNKISPMPKQFKSISELNLADYSYETKKMSVHELVSDSIESHVYSLASILISCV